MKREFFPIQPEDRHILVLKEPEMCPGEELEKGNMINRTETYASSGDDYKPPSALRDSKHKRG